MAMIGDTRGQNTYNTTGATFQLIGNLLQGEKNARGTKPRTLDFVLILKNNVAFRLGEIKTFPS